MSSDNEYMTVEEASTILGVVPRQVNRYGTTGRIRTRRAGRRVLYFREDVLELAEELGAAHRPAPAPRPEIMPVGEMLNYLRDRDRQLEGQQQQISMLLAKLAEAQAELGRRLLPQDEQQLRDDLTTVRAERDELRRQIAALNPWYRRWYVWLIISLVLALGLAAALGALFL